MNYTSTIPISPAFRNFNDPDYLTKAREVANFNSNAVDKIQACQPDKEYIGTIHILWNKTRYFEFSIIQMPNVLRFVAQSAKIKIQYKNMLIGPNHKLEAVVKALNKCNIFVIINKDWI